MRVNSLFSTAVVVLLAIDFGISSSQGTVNPPDPSVPMTMQSVYRIMNFTNTFSMEYFTHNLGGVTQVRFTLRLRDYNITNWSTQGKQGIWLGLGFGEQVMEGSDIIHC